MPLLLPPLPSTSADVSDEALSSLEPSTLLLEAERLQNSIQKLEESNAALEEFVQGGQEGQQGEGGEKEGSGVTEEEEKLFTEVRRENEEVMCVARPTLAESTGTGSSLCLTLNPFFPPSCLLLIRTTEHGKHPSSRGYKSRSMPREAQSWRAAVIPTSSLVPLASPHHPGRRWAQGLMEMAEQVARAMGIQEIEEAEHE